MVRIASARKHATGSLAFALLCLSSVARAGECPEGTIKIGEQRTETATAIVIQPRCQRVPAAAPAVTNAPAASQSQQQSSSATETPFGRVAAKRGTVYIKTKDGRIFKAVSSSKVPLGEGTEITTGANGRIQILLPDDTIFTLGPSSDMVLDDFVYDPASSAITVDHLAVGTFRFINAHIKHGGKVEEKKIPVGTIGIRG